jgi:hypothetical protein
VPSGGNRQEQTKRGEVLEAPTLVACGAGMSRSPAIVAAAMATLEGGTLADALGKLTAGQPHDVSASLLAEISNVLSDQRAAKGK